ncbi:MAG: penicillin-binding transpeptidase domain-containing protein, partial [Acutalibacteraceae bacterium]
IREIIIIAFVVLVFTLFGVNLFRIQVINAPSEEDRIITSSSTKVEAARGEIYDRNGKLLVTNSQSNSLIFDDNFFPKANEMEKRVEIIDALIKLFEENDAEWRDELPIKIKNGEAVFKSDSESSITYLKSKDFLNLNEYATAENCLDALIERYSLESYSKSRARKIASVCYLMKKELFSSSAPYTFAEDVPGELVAMVKENSEFYQGVDVKIVSEREYTDGTIAPHIIGVVGAINAEEYAEKKDEGYSYTSFIGKSGIEKAMESYLKGTDGEKVVVTNADGEKETIYTKEPQKGNSVVLTIDSDVQKAVQDALDEVINVTLKDKQSYQLSGACVVEELATGDVIAAASYPTYDLSTYWENASQLNSDSLAPLWNRAFQSTYTPGSTMKLAVSMAGLEEGVITGSSYKYKCTSVYTYYDDYRPKCLGYHGYQNVVNALYNSCNCFFYEVSRLLGIDKLNEYCAMFGLGSKTGIEINESEGTLDSIASRSALGEQWTPGFTLQAGIGHGNNMFTPIQMCSYVATVANEGTRRKASLVKSVFSSDFSELVYETPNEILSQANFSSSNWALVKEGMRMVGDHYFKNAVVPVCAKTGTTTVTKTINGRQIETNNGLIVCYAPADNPKIAISVVVEGASSGGSVAPVAAAAINAYFGAEDAQQSGEQTYNDLL